ncbi:Pkinase-domain-containing protein [Amanita rubescens]|nr:Pkinase-domain-containing protein [Amanita rubescens]
MPPPDTIPVSHTSRSAINTNDRESNRTLGKQGRSPTRESKIGITGSPSTRAHRSAGFKPINQPNQASSSLKKFFPGDDEDMDLASDDHPSDAPVTSESGPDVTKVPDDSRYQRNGILEDRRAHSPDAKADGVQLSPNLHDRPSSRRSLMENKDILKIVSGPCTPSETVQVREGASPSATTSRELYKILSQVGEGTFGKVYKAQNTVTKVHVALKRIRMEAEKDGFPVTAMREIKLLQSLRHENVVRLYEMMVSNGAVYMVFEYMDHDLTGVLSQTQFTFSNAHLKSLCHQMLAGLAYLHHKGVIHRDIKGSNILVNNRGELKLADFGLARFYHKRRQSDYTNRVITLWYRPPELLFGATVYGPEVDMWSAGCIMLELFTKKPVFQGNDEIHQLDVVHRIFGTPTVERWPAVMNLPWYELIKPKENIPNHFRELFQKWMSSAALDLAEQLLSYDPSRRITAVQAMEAPYFIEEQPPAERPVGLSTLEGEWHELETKKERARKRKKETA